MGIDESLVASLVGSQFPQWADLPIKQVVPGGWDNRTFRLGDTMSVRLPSAERYAEKIEKEQQWLPHLAASILTQIPCPIGLGRPEFGYPWNWSIYRWLEGEEASYSSIDSLIEFARSMAKFLADLHLVSPIDEAQPGSHNFHRGGSLMVYDSETRELIRSLRDTIDPVAATKLWETALRSSWNHPPVWVHGDLAPSNILVRDGALSSVIDFGGCGVGDPSCDLTIAWTFFAGESRETFRSGVALDRQTWERARGWALWKALLIAKEHSGENGRAHIANATIEAVLAEHEQLSA